VRRTIPALFFVAACGPVVSSSDETTSTSAGDTTEVTAASTVTTVGTSATTVGTTASTTVDPETGGSAESSAGEAEGNPFIRAPDGGGAFECDPWVDDCPRGFKCMPWANDGGTAWNAWKCTPLAEDPNGVGEPCTVVESGVSGIDDCEARAMCWNVDPDTLMGECIAFCGGSRANPTCADPCTRCHITGDGVLIPCLPTCDPIAQDCGAGQACYPVDDTFACAPDASEENGALGDDCEFINVCDPGLFCANPDSVPDCAGAVGCCAAFCNVSAEDPCAGIPGVECIPWDEQEEPGCVSGVVGGCLLPE